MDEGALRDHLHQIGLSDKEVDIYLTVIEQGEAKASTIAEGAGVSKRYVYSVCEELERRGFVEANDHRTPTTIRAKDPERAFSNVSERLSEVGSTLAERYERSPVEERQLEVIKSTQTLLKRMRAGIAEAEEEVTLSVPESVVPELREELSAAVERGVAVLVLVGAPREERGETAWEEVASLVRVWGQQLPVLMTVDQSIGIVSPAEMFTVSNAPEQAIMIAQRQIVPVLAGSFFANYWAVAEEAYVTDPDPLPTTYDSFRHAVLQAELHRRADHPIEATVFARPTDATGDPEEMTGLVVDVQQSLVDPPSNTFPVQNSLVIDIDGTELTVGGRGAFVETYESHRTTLLSVE